MFAPAQAPDAAVARMSKEIAAVVAQPAVKAKLLEQGAEGRSSSPEALGKIVSHEISQWRAVVKHAGIQAD